jgi:hypothetical protein
VVLVQVVAAALLVLGSLLVLRAVSLADANPRLPRRGSGPVLVPKPAAVQEVEAPADWRRAA